MWPRARDILLFAAGLVGVVHETAIRQGPERPTLLLLFAAMMGLPVFLAGDRDRNGKNGNGKDE